MKSNALLVKSTLHCILNAWSQDAYSIIYIEGNSEDRLTWDVKHEDLVEEYERHEGEERSQ